MGFTSRERNLKANQSLSKTQDMADDGDLFYLLTRIFILNEEERFRAGIYIGYEGKRWINQASLVLPLADEEEITPYIINPGENK